MSLSVLNHAINFVVGKGGRTGNGDLLLLAGAQILSGNVHDAICVDVEGNLNLRNATTCSRNTGELELAQGLVVLGHLTLALQNVDLYRSLIVGCGGIDFRLAGRNGGVAVDHLGHYAAHGFNAKGKRGNVKKKDALNVASKNAALNSCAHCNNLIGVNRHVGLLARHVLHQLLNSRHTGGTANEDYLVNIARRKASVAQSLLNRLLAAVE